MVFNCFNDIMVYFLNMVYWSMVNFFNNYYFFNDNFFILSDMMFFTGYFMMNNFSNNIINNYVMVNSVSVEFSNVMLRFFHMIFSDVNVFKFFFNYIFEIPMNNIFNMS